MRQLPGCQAPECSEPTPLEEGYFPPAPKPQALPLKPIALIRTLKRNPLECWAARHFEQPIVAGGLPIGHVLLVHEPIAIRRVLLDNSANYRKDHLQRRVLSAGLNEGLLSAEGEQWRLQRRVLAPIFARKAVMDFTSAMMEAAEALLNRWRSLGDQITIDVAAEMARVTLGVLERTIFSDGFGSDAEDIRAAMATYFNTIGKISPLDLLGVPNFVPRLSRLRVRPTLKFFEAEVDKVISTRRRILAEQPDGAPDDLLTRLLEALDTNTDGGITESEVRSNILTFIAAGHETTANTLSWAMLSLCLSSVRGRAADMHRVHFRTSRSDTRACHDCKALQLSTKAGARGMACFAGDIAPDQRIAHDHQKKAIKRRRELKRFPVDLIHAVVMCGLDPRIHHLRKIHLGPSQRLNCSRNTVRAGSPATGCRCSSTLRPRAAPNVMSGEASVTMRPSRSAMSVPLLEPWGRYGSLRPRRDGRHQRVA